MSDFGIELILDDGTTAVDSTFYNHSIKSSGSITPVNTTLYTNSVVYYTAKAYIATVPLSASGAVVKDQPIVGVHSKSFVAMADCTYSGGSLTAIKLMHGSSGKIDYFTSSAPPPGGDDYGIQVFNSSGQKVFDGSYKYMRLVDVVNVITPTEVKYYNLYNGLCEHTSGGGFTACEHLEGTRRFSHKYVAKPYYLVNNLYGEAFSRYQPSYSDPMYQFAKLGVRNIDGYGGEVGWIQFSAAQSIGSPHIYAPSSQQIFVFDVA